MYVIMNSLFELFLNPNAAKNFYFNPLSSISLKKYITTYKFRRFSYFIARVKLMCAHLNSNDMIFFSIQKGRVGLHEYLKLLPIVVWNIFIFSDPLSSCYYFFFKWLRINRHFKNIDQRTGFLLSEFYKSSYLII